MSLSKISLKLLKSSSVISPDLESIIFPEIYPIPIFEPKTYNQIFEEKLPSEKNNEIINGEDSIVDGENPIIDGLNKPESIYNELITYKVIPYDKDSLFELVEKNNSNLKIQFLPQSLEEEEELKIDSELKKKKFFNFLLFILSSLLMNIEVKLLKDVEITIISCKYNFNYVIDYYCYINYNEFKTILEVLVKLNQTIKELYTNFVITNVLNKTKLDSFVPYEEKFILFKNISKPIAFLTEKTTSILNILKDYNFFVKRFKYRKIYTEKINTLE